MAIINIFFPLENITLLSIWDFFAGYHQVTIDNFINHQLLIPFTLFVIEPDPEYSLHKFDLIHVFLEYDPLTFVYFEHSIGFTFNPSVTRVCLSITPNESNIKYGFIGLHYTPLGGERRWWNKDDGDDEDWRRFRPRKPKPTPVLENI
jgi:hypothetical protein